MDPSTQKHHGFAVIHSNQLESLQELITHWMKEHPIPALESECFLVQSQGIAQWLKIGFAKPQGLGIAAGMEFVLPNQFMWRLYRSVLGETIPSNLPYDKPNLAWRLFRLLPELLAQPSHDFKEIEQYLGASPSEQTEELRRWHLACRLADLYDAYQVYRADWLNGWSNGHDVWDVKSSHFNEQKEPLPEAYQWQAALWRALREDLTLHAAPSQYSSRADVHDKALQALQDGVLAHPELLPKRVVVFGISSLPQQFVELLAQLGRHTQVLLAVLNPCRYFWADIQAPKDRARWQRYQQKNQAALSVQDGLDDEHFQTQPLLASWGKQGKEYIHLLSDYDHPADYEHWFQGRIDYFTDSQASSEAALPLLHQIQQDILNLEPLPAPTQKHTLPEQDRSLTFHCCYSRYREVEVLQDQLLADFEADPSLELSDVLIMTPDISQYAAHIDAVFGRLSYDDPRYLPYSMADQKGRQQEPLMIAVEFLLSLHQQNVGFTDVFALLEITAIQNKLALDTESLPTLQTWFKEAGVHWGLDEVHRDLLGVTSMAQAFTWFEGVERLLLGYAIGADVEWQERLPYPHVAGMDAESLGSMIRFIRILKEWLHVLLIGPQSLTAWQHALFGEHGVLEQLFDPVTDQESFLLLKLKQGFEILLEQASAGQFQQEVSLDVLREAWLSEVEETGLSQRFLVGRLTFSTLLPMRAIPFKRIYILGLNDTEFPRVSAKDDFNLMYKSYRAGDRSRRDDDRYLFLEALLSARQSLYLSWVAFDAKTNEEKTASVLVTQLYTMIEQGWQLPPGGLKTVYPLQGFSPQYFQKQQQGQEQQWVTYQQEWESVYTQIDAQQPAAAIATESLGLATALPIRANWQEHEQAFVTREELQKAVLSPVDYFVAHQYHLTWKEGQIEDPDVEPILLDGLDHWKLLQAVLQSYIATKTGQPSEALFVQPQHDLSSPDQLKEHFNKVWQQQRVLPYGSLGQRQVTETFENFSTLQKLLDPLLMGYRPMIKAEQGQLSLNATHVIQVKELEKALGSQELKLEMQQDKLWIDYDGKALRFVDVTASKLKNKSNKLRFSKVFPMWLQVQLASLAGHSVPGTMIGVDGAVEIRPLDAVEAQKMIQIVISLWLASAQQPLPLQQTILDDVLAPVKSWDEDSLDDTGLDKALQGIEDRYKSAYYGPSYLDYSIALQRYYPDGSTLEQQGIKSWLVGYYGVLYNNIKQCTESEPEGKQS